MDFTYEIPDERAFLRTIVLLLKKEGHLDLASNLSKADCHISTTGTFTRIRWNEYSAEVTFSLPFEEFEKFPKDYEQILRSLCNRVMPTQAGYSVQHVEISPMIVGFENEEKSTEPYFEEQQRKIIDEISKARFAIWVAVAWFTDMEILKALLEKKRQGLNIRIVVVDDEINAASAKEFEKHFEVKRHPQFGHYGNNIMHDKFCIIDFLVVIHGSYNWSKRAMYNKETVTIDRDRQLAEKFAEEFKKLIMAEK